MRVVNFIKRLHGTWEVDVDFLDRVNYIWKTTRVEPYSYTKLKKQLENIPARRRLFENVIRVTSMDEKFRILDRIHKIDEENKI